MASGFVLGLGHHTLANTLVIHSFNNIYILFIDFDMFYSIYFLFTEPTPVLSFYLGKCNRATGLFSFSRSFCNYIFGHLE